MPYKLNAITGKFDLVNTGDVEGPASSTDNALARWDGTTGKLIQNSVGILDDDGYLTGLLGVSTTSAAVSYYANSSTGSDSYDGKSATVDSATRGPKLTLDGANGLFSIIPMLIPGIVTLNLVGTFTRDSVSIYRLPSPNAKSGNTDYPSVIKVVGDTATPANVILRNFSSTGSMFQANVGNNVWDFTGVTFDDGRVGITSQRGQVIFRNVLATNIRDGGPYFQATDAGRIRLEPATVPLTYDCNATGSVTAIVFAVQRFGLLDLNTSQNMTISGVKNNAGISCGNFGRIVQSSAVITINGDAAVGGHVGIQMTGFGFATMRNVTIDKMTHASSTAQCGIYFSDAFNNYLQVGGTTLNITNSTNGIILAPLCKFRDSAAVTYNFAGTTTPVQISHGALAESTNIFSGAAITYIPGGLASAIHGYDDRYQMTDRPTIKRTAVADAAYVVLTTDAAISYTTLTAARAITLPTASSATAGMTAGDIRIFYIIDETGNCSGVNTLTSAVAGAGTINGAANFVQNVAYSAQAFYCIAGGANAYFTI